jgi:hypothetical protein
MDENYAGATTPHVDPIREAIPVLMIASSTRCTAKSFGRPVASLLRNLGRHATRAGEVSARASETGYSIKLMQMRTR